MLNATKLLSDDGRASIATALLMSHHAFRRDVAQFAAALKRVGAGKAARTAALLEEWQGYRGALHGHHEMEDTQIFPHIKAEHPEVASVIERLSADHRRIDPILERGDRAFKELSSSIEAAARVIAELSALLDDHLALEEKTIVPFLRAASDFPTPSNDAEAALYADGFAWSSHGVAPAVLERVYAMLPEILSSKLPAARAAFEERCKRVWGSATSGASDTSVPDRLPGTRGE